VRCSPRLSHTVGTGQVYILVKAPLPHVPTQVQSANVFNVNYSGRSTTIKRAGQWKVIEASELAHGCPLRWGGLLC
jgi:hypothetical protein